MGGHPCHDKQCCQHTKSNICTTTNLCKCVSNYNSSTPNHSLIVAKISKKYDYEWSFGFA